MWDDVPRVISVATELPAVDNLFFIMLATFATVVLLAWLNGFNDPRTSDGAHQRH